MKNMFFLLMGFLGLFLCIFLGFTGIEIVDNREYINYSYLLEKAFFSSLKIYAIGVIIGYLTSKK